MFLAYISILLPQRYKRGRCFVKIHSYVELWIRRSSMLQILITDDLRKTALPIWSPNLEDGSGDKMLNKWVILGAYPNIVFQFTAHLKAEIHGYLITKCSYMVSKSAKGRIFEFWKKQQKKNKKKKKKKTCMSKHVWANCRQYLFSIRWTVLSKNIFHFLLAYGLRYNGYQNLRIILSFYLLFISLGNFLFGVV